MEVWMTEGPRVNFVMHEALFEIDTWILCQSLYLYFIKIVLFLLRNIRFLIQNTRSLFYGGHYSSLHRLMSLHGKMDVKIFLMFIVAENTRSVNILQRVVQLLLLRIEWTHIDDIYKKTISPIWDRPMPTTGKMFSRLRCLSHPQGKDNILHYHIGPCIF